MTYDNYGGSERGPIIFIDEYKLQMIIISTLILFDAYSDNGSSQSV